MADANPEEEHIKRKPNALVSAFNEIRDILQRDDLFAMANPAFFLRFLYHQWFDTPKYPGESFEGKTVIVTGANIGLGFEAAKHYVRLGGEKVILACRSVEKGEKARAEIEASEKSKGVVEVWQLDLANYASVKAFAERAKKLKRLDVLLENAGVSTSKFKLAEDNESTVTTNVVSTFLLGLLLLPKLKETAKTYNTTPHLTIVSSEVHQFTKIEERKNPVIFDALNDPKKSHMSDRYNVSKLLEVFATRQMVADYCPDSEKYPVVINYMNPGFCHSSLMREAGAWQAVFKFIMGARSTEKGSRTLVDATIKGPESHGQYCSNCRVEAPAAFVLSDEGKQTQQRVWKELSQKLEKIQPGILQNF